MFDEKQKLIRQGDIYWVNFDPSVGAEIQKKRPAVVIQDHYVAERSQTVLVCPIISSDRIHPLDIPMRNEALSKNSRVRCIQVVTCDVSRFDAYVGALEISELELVLDNVCLLIGRD